MTSQGPLCDQTEFDELMAEMVADEAPRLFAVVQEEGEREDGWIAGWGLAFADHVEVVGEGGRISARSPERVRWLLNRRQGLTAHLIWINPVGVS